MPKNCYDMNMPQEKGYSVQNFSSQVISVYVNNFDESTVRSFFEGMSLAENSGQGIVPIYIDSFGGDATSVMAMIDIIESCRIPVATISLGKSMSCGAFLLGAGTPGARFAAPTSSIMMHHIWSGTHGKTQDMKSDVSETERIQEILFGKFDKYTKRKKNFWLKELKNRGNVDWYLSPQDALKLGIVDHVRLPKLFSEVLIKNWLE